MHLDWSTLALQTVNVLVLLWLLRRYLFRPVMASVAARRAAAEALLAEAAAQRTAAEATAAELARRARDSAAEAERLRAAAAAGAEAERTQRLAAAGAEIGRLRDAAAAAIRRDRAAMRQELDAAARALAVTIAARLLARLPGPAATAAMLDALGAGLAGLPEAELHALAAPGAPLDVVSAAPLNEAEREACAALLRAAGRSAAGAHVPGRSGADRGDRAARPARRAAPELAGRAGADRPGTSPGRRRCRAAPGLTAPPPGSPPRRWGRRWRASGGWNTWATASPSSPACRTSGSTSWSGSTAARSASCIPWKPS